MDECTEQIDNCSHNCSDTLGSYQCVCYDGYILDSDAHTCNGEQSFVTTRAYSYCCVDVDECEEGTAECHTNATCTNTDGSYNCSCVYGYSGDGWNCTSRAYLRNVVCIFTSLSLCRDQPL